MAAAMHTGNEEMQGAFGVQAGCVPGSPFIVAAMMEKRGTVWIVRGKGRVLPVMGFVLGDYLAMPEWGELSPLGPAPGAPGPAPPRGRGAATLPRLG